MVSSEECLCRFESGDLIEVDITSTAILLDSTSWGKATALWLEIHEVCSILHSWVFSWLIDCLWFSCLGNDLYYTSYNRLHCLPIHQSSLKTIQISLQRSAFTKVFVR